MARIAVFIDGGYFRKVLREFGLPTVCYLKLSTLVAGDDERLRTYYYDCPPFVSNPPTQEERERKSAFDRFISALQWKLPRFQLRLGRLAKYITTTGDRFIQKKVDVLLAVDLVRLSVDHQIQRAVLIAGDSDFVPAIQIARDSGVIVQLYYHDTPRPHDELLNACDDRILIDGAFIDSIRQ